MKIGSIIFASAALLAAPALAQQTTGTSAATPDGKDVNASTYGSGTVTPTSQEVTGGGAAGATDGTATSDSSAKFNDHMAMQRSTAEAQNDDARARSRTMTHTNRNGLVHSNSMSLYKEKGERPVVTHDNSVVTPGESGE